MRIALGLVCLVACSHDHHGNPDGGGDDDAPSADAAAPDALADAAADGAPDAPADAAGCGTLGAQPADVYVAGASTLDSVGTAACPFHTILEATALAVPDAGHPRTIHVATGQYTEAGLIQLTDALTLAGAGMAQVTLAGGGHCVFAATTCTVSMAGGAALRGVTVTSATGDAVEVTGGAGTAAIDHALVTDAHDTGILIRGISTTLDTVEVRASVHDGVNAKTANVTVTNSDFRNNHDSGLEIDQAATLNLTGGNITDNFDGVYLHNGTSFTVLAHTITNVQILQNLGFGIDLSSNASLTLRGTTLLNNEVGVYLLFGQNVLDIGTAASPGNNVFSGTAATHQNVRAGLCIENSPATAVQVVEGNTWRGCPPPVRKIPGPFCRSNNTYSDIAFVPAVATSGSPVIAPAACTVGP